jgi:hypothetical protein
MTTKMPVSLPSRGYDRGFDWTYEAPAVEPSRTLIPVVWDGLWLNTGDQETGLCLVVENITGWLDSPPLDGNDVARVISDGAAWGPKVLGPRSIVITGAVTGPRQEMGRFRDQLAVRAANREPVLLEVGDYDLERVLTADVRAGSEMYRHTPLGPTGFRWQVTLTAADPALYDAAWQTVTLGNLFETDTGREYQRTYQWRYNSPYVGNSGVLRNAGNYPAPVYALYAGDLAESLLTDNGQSGIIRVARVEAGMEILVSTATLTAEAAGGVSRASYILPGSRPLFVPPLDTSRWFLRSTGYGSVTLVWRSAWV